MHFYTLRTLLPFHKIHPFVRVIYLYQLSTVYYLFAVFYIATSLQVLGPLNGASQVVVVVVRRMLRSRAIDH